MRRGEGAKFQFFLFPTRHFFNTHQKKSITVLTTQRDREKKKVLTLQLASAVTFFSFGTMEAPPFTSASVMKESVSHTGAMTRAESPPVGDEDDCNSRAGPTFYERQPQPRARGQTKAGELNRVDRRILLFEHRHYTSCEIC